MDFNPNLRPWSAPQPNNVAGKGQIEKPGTATNLVWQHRAALPTDYENALGDALLKCFESGAETLPAVVDHLNVQGIRTMDGQQWTEVSLAAQLHSLAA
ncbi:recombinase-like helix-turn-helix domain-containing protein [Glaciimonas soli]|uniref:Recombinase-like domain-containing protein n=1 Tax=Glaciimonas soli TaxID=2590999 RepID=A0A843YQH7_9BURK|nr:recombinase-like helix-turn-helix domain-containing protein [Glaciimonas soli]MQQ99640.1 hypothetical protein [Glaciimonas soli]